MIPSPTLEGLEETREIRNSDWKIGPIPADLHQRRVEITGPVDRKMVINALNSGADVYMADFEDSHSPTWNGTLQGQVNLRDAIDRIITYTGPDGREYRLGEKLATLFVRPRGLHLTEKHTHFGSNPTPAFLFDYSLFVYHNAKKLASRGTGPYIYIPKLENYQEARLWNDIFDYTEKALKLPHASVKCSVLIETILAAFQMDEILFSLRERITALNFGRWDYIFSLIKFLGENPRFVVPERPLLPMTTPFLKSCSILLVQTCHKRGAYAIRGIPGRVGRSPSTSACRHESIQRPSSGIQRRWRDSKGGPRGSPQGPGAEDKRASCQSEYCREPEISRVVVGRLRVRCDQQPDGRHGDGGDM